MCTIDTILNVSMRLLTGNGTINENKVNEIRVVYRSTISKKAYTNKKKLTVLGRK
jgi:hypothetical protein